MLWWNAAYTSRIRVTIPARSGGYAAGDVVRFEFGESVSMVALGQVRRDRRDLRVVYDAGTAVEIDRVLMDTGTVEFRLQAAIAPNVSSADYWLYHGNAGETTEPLADPRNVYPFFADGDDLASLTKTGPVAALQVPRPRPLKFRSNPASGRPALHANGGRNFEGLIKSGGTYYAYYDGMGVSGGTATLPSMLMRSTDLVHWTEQEVLVSTPPQTPPVGYESDGAPSPMCQVTIDGQLKWFGVYLLVLNGAKYVTGYCLADTLEGPWTGMGQLIPNGPETYDVWGTGDSQVLTLDGGATWLCVYSCVDSNHSRGVALATATSPLGPWTKQGVIIPTTEQIENPRLIHDPVRGMYYIFVNGVGGYMGGYGTFTNEVSLYWSASLMSGWGPPNKSSLVIPDNPPAWDSLTIGLPSPPVFEDGAIYFGYDGSSREDAAGPNGTVAPRDVGFVEAPWPFPWGNALKLGPSPATASKSAALAGDGTLTVRGRFVDGAAGLRSGANSYYAQSIIDATEQSNWNQAPHVRASVNGTVFDPSPYIGSSTTQTTRFDFTRAGASMTIRCNGVELWTGACVTGPLDFYASGTDVVIECVQAAPAVVAASSASVPTVLFPAAAARVPATIPVVVSGAPGATVTVTTDSGSVFNGVIDNSGHVRIMVTFAGPGVRSLSVTQTVDGDTTVPTKRAVTVLARADLYTVPPGATAADISAALAANLYVKLTAGQTYTLTQAVVLPSGCYFDLNGSTLRLANGANAYILQNANRDTGDTQIVVVNGVLDGNGLNQTRLLGTGQAWTTDYVGAGTCFARVNGLWMDGVTLREANSWGVSYWLCDLVLFSNITCDALYRPASWAPGTYPGNGDGVTGVARRAYVWNIGGYTNDDMVAISTGRCQFAPHLDAYNTPALVKEEGLAPADNIDVEFIDIRNVSAGTKTGPNGVKQAMDGVGLYATAGKRIKHAVIDGMSGAFSWHSYRVADFWGDDGLGLINEVHVRNQNSTPGVMAGTPFDPDYPGPSEPGLAFNVHASSHLRLVTGWRGPGETIPSVTVVGGTASAVRYPDEASWEFDVSPETVLLQITVNRSDLQSAYAEADVAMPTAAGEGGGAGEARLYGARAAGTTITVSGPGVIGATTYPTAATWEASVTGLPAGASVFAVSDGTGWTRVVVEPAGADALLVTSHLMLFDAADAYLAARGMMVGLSYLAGPYAYIDYPQDSALLSARLGVSPSSSFSANWAKDADAIAAAFGYASVSQFASAWSHATQFAAAHGVSFGSSYVVPERGAALFALALGFESAAAFTASFSRAQQIASRLGFSSVSAFVALWEQAAAFDARLGLSFEDEWFNANEGVLRLGARFGMFPSSYYVGPKPVVGRCRDRSPRARASMRTPGLRLSDRSARSHLLKKG